MRRIGAALLGAFTLFGASPASAERGLASCRAEALKRYIGEAVEALERVRQSDVRYVCAGCAMTAEDNTGRLTVVYDRKTDRIARLGCY